MGRPATSSPDGKRDFEVKSHFNEAEYDDLCALAHLMKKTKSELIRELFHIQAYGLLGARFSPSVDNDGRAGIVPAVLR
ncbi:MAG: hypothetical protein ACREPX_01645 [Rhodanobacteraceae bacterium]